MSAIITSDLFYACDNSTQNTKKQKDIFFQLQYFYHFGYI